MTLGRVRLPDSSSRCGRVCGVASQAVFARGGDSSELWYATSERVEQRHTHPRLCLVIESGRQVLAEVKSWSCLSQSHSIFVGCSKWGSREDITNSYYDSIQKSE